MSSNYPGIKLEQALGTWEDKIKHLSTHLQNWSFHVVERTRTSTKCQKMKNARAKRAKILFFIVKYANLWGFCCRRRRGCLSSLIPHHTWYWAKPGNKRGPTDSPAVFIASAGKKVCKASRYPMLYAFVQLMGFGGQPGATAALCAWPFGSTTRFELRSYPFSIVRPTTTELSVAVSRISVQASIPRKVWNSNWITVRIFTTWKGRHIYLV